MKSKVIPSSLLSFANLVKDDLTSMDELIKSLTLNHQETIFAITNYLISSGGKRLRPILTLICAKLLPDDVSIKARSINLAAAVELIHTATLLHDDVVDGSVLRRGNKTANTKWSNKHSILVGDFLLSQAFRLMVKDGSLEILDLLSHTAAVIAQGEVMQIACAHNLKTTQQEYLKIVSAKTAQLFAAATKTGAMIAGCEVKITQALYDFGYYLGIAFQIIDDVLDYCAKQQDLGKEIGDDFREGKITLPIIFACMQADDLEYKFLEKIFVQLEQSPEDLAKTIALLEATNAMKNSKQLAKHYIALAKVELDKLAPGKVKDALGAILAFSQERTY
jgi:octaprenyl-diphosphate synthase